MNRNTIYIRIWILCLLIACAMPSEAIPVFARKYGFNCTMCHSSYPRLNDYGVRYRNNGYQLPGRENDERTALEGPAPFAGRTSTGYTSEKFSNVEGAEKVDQFQINGLDLLSAGLFKENVGYFMIYVPQINGTSGVAAQNATLEMANVVFSHIGSSMFNVRVGRFEPAYVAFSVKRHLSFSPYEIYDFSFPSGQTLSETQTGLEIYGYNLQGCQYAAGLVNGSGTNRDNDSPADFYIRAAKVFGQGEGQTAGQRIGVVGYYGKARQYLSPSTASPHNFQRFGVDASLNYTQWNLALQYISGKDNKALWGAESDVSFNGGFAELTYMPAFDFAAFVRKDNVNPNDTSGIRDINRWTIGGRYNIYENIALHLEYSDARQRNAVGPNSTAKFFTTRVDIAF